MNGIGYKIKKTILYILLILLSVVCMFPFLLMIVNATRSGSEIMKSFTLIPSVYLKENWATMCISLRERTSTVKKFSRRQRLPA